MKFGIILWSVYSLLTLYVLSSPLLVVDNDVDDESSGIIVITLKGKVFLPHSFTHSLTHWPTHSLTGLLPSMIFVFHSLGYIYLLSIIYRG